MLLRNDNVDAGVTASDSTMSALRIIGLASCMVWFGISGFVESSPAANTSDLYTFVVLAVVLFCAACFPRGVVRVLGKKPFPVICGFAAGAATMLPFLLADAELVVFVAPLLAGFGLSTLLLSWGTVLSSLDFELMIKELLLAQLLMSLFRLACDFAPLVLGSGMRACFVVLSGCCLAALISKGDFNRPATNRIRRRSDYPIARLIWFVVAVNLWALAINQLYNIYRFCSPLNFASLSPIAIVIEIAFVAGLYFLVGMNRFKENHFYLMVVGSTLIAFLLLPIFGLESPVPFFVLFVGFSALSLLVWVLSARASSQSNAHPITVFGCSLGSFLGVQIAIARLSAPSLFAPLSDMPVGLSILCFGGVLTVLAAYFIVFKSQMLSDSGGHPESEAATSEQGDAFANWEALSERYGLTQRESEVLLLFAKGRSYARIQEMLYISRGTVNYHMNNAYRKLEISSRQELLDIVERSESDE